MADLEADFTILHPFVTHPDITVYRALRRSDGLPVVLKRPTPSLGSADDIARLAYEYEMLQFLAERVPNLGVVKPVQLWGSTIDSTLVLHDVGGQSLAEFSVAGRLPARQVIDLGLAIARALQQVHAAGVIHKDINPRNVIYNQTTGLVQLIDFGIAVRLSSETKGGTEVQGADGTLAYAPPEQVGRVARYADHRSDFYSLGATLYALVCGRPLFVEQDMGRLMHQVLTTEPLPPERLVPDVPTELSQVICKLVDKTQERRYQSAGGIIFDLQQCADILDGTRQTFTLGGDDRNERFEIPRKVFGRHSELQVLREAFAEAASGTVNLVLLGGSSGVGKSSLVAELQADLVGRGALLGTGKHEQLRRHLPFSALAQAITGLIRGFLFEPEAASNERRRRIAGALGSVAQAIVEIIPAIEILLGPQKPVIQLPTQENEHRLHYLLQRLVLALAEQQPLMLFLDDLQWADAGTIHLLRELLYSSERCAGLCIIAAYRDDEIIPEHPLSQLMHALDEEEVPFTKLLLGPLPPSATLELLYAATGAPLAEVHALSQVVHAKTHGNPFFTGEYLRHLHEHGLLRFDVQSRHFVWDVQEIIGTSVADNVVVLLVQKLRTLQEETQSALSMAACLGNQFSLEDLQQVTGMERASLAQRLAGALDAGLIVPLSASYRYAAHSQTDVHYKFAHDRIQQATFSLFSPAAAEQAHRAVGLYLRTIWDAEPNKVSMFDMLEHLNAATALVESPQERLDLAQLNLAGAQEAKRAGALEVAQTYLEAAWSLLGEQAWSQQPTASRTLQLELADIDFLAGNIDSATRRLQEVVRRSADVWEHAQVEVRRVYALTAAGDLHAALDAGLRGLRLVGVRLPVHPTQLHLAGALIQVLIAMRGRGVESFLTLPPMKDPHAAIIVELLSSFKMAAFYTNPRIFALLALVAPRYSIRYGVNRRSSYSFGLLALVLVQLNLYKPALHLAKITRRHAEERPDSLERGTIEFSATCFIEFFALSAEDLLTHFKRAYRVCLESGEPLFGGWAAMFCSISVLWVSFKRCQLELEAYESFIVKRNEKHQVYNVHEVRRTMDVLRGSLSLQSYMAPEHRTAAIELGAAGGGHALCFRAITLWILGERDAIWQIMLDGQAGNIHELVAEMMMPYFALYTCLAYCHRLAQHKPIPIAQRLYYLRLRAKLRAVGRAGPRHYGGLDTLIRANLRAIRGRTQQANQLFEQAIEELSTSDFSVFRSTAYECAGRHMAQQGMPLAARGYLQSAADIYRLLGADAKVAAMNEEFGSFMGANVLSRSTGATRTRTVSATRSDTTGSSDATERLVRSALHSLHDVIEGDFSADQLGDAAVRCLTEACAATRVFVRIDDSQHVAHFYDSSGHSTSRPSQLMEFVARSRELVTSQTLATVAPAERDPYFANSVPKSMCCVPALHHGTLRGVFYLENAIIPDVFSTPRLAVLHELVTWIVLAFENLEYRREMNRVMAARTSEMQLNAERLLQTQKESTELQLAGGFAHELRNALSAAAFPLGMMRRAVPAAAGVETLQDTFATVIHQLEASAGLDLAAPIADLRASLDTLDACVEEVQHGVHRGLAITQQVLEYAQASHIIAGSDKVRLRHLVDEVIKENSARLQAGDIACSIEVPDNLSVYITEMHAHAIVRNLLQNACDALAECEPGQQRRIRVSAELVEKDVQLAIEDSGVGIAEAHQRRIFEPFYSTKGVGGTGLGLGFSRKLAAAYGGSLTFTSQEKRGTTFVLRLPRVDVPPTKAT